MADAILELDRRLIPLTVDEIKSTLTGLRHAKVPLTLGTIQAIIIARINTDLPRLFIHKARDGSIFWATVPWCCRFLHCEMQWSIRHAT